MTLDAAAHERVIWALRRANLAATIVKEQRLRPLGLPGAHYGVLMHAAREPGVVGAELARRLDVSPQNVAGLVAKLEERGLLERRPHPQHRHVLELHLTPAGEAELAKAEQVMQGIEADLIAILGNDDAQHLRALLERVVAGFDGSPA